MDESTPPPPTNPAFFTIRTLSNPTAAPLRFDSNRLYTVGRSNRHFTDDVIVLPGRHVSRRHCQILLDPTDRKLRLLDGYFRHVIFDDVISRFRSSSSTSAGSRVRVSSNGVFVNGCRIQRGSITELFIGDEVLLGCNNRRKACYGFVVEKIEFSKPNFGEEIVINKACMLLKRCRSIIGTTDPISLLRNREKNDYSKNDEVIVIDSSSSGHVGNSDVDPSNPLELMSNEGMNPNMEVKLPELLRNQEKSDEVIVIDSDSFGPVDVGNADTDPDSGCFSDGKTIFLNRLNLDGMNHSMEVTLPELLHPVESLIRIFVATFTSDVPWFLSYCQLPNHLPITIACHSADRCWSANRDSRTSAPFEDYPNLLLVYPPFPEVIAFGNDLKKRGVACHHPKLIVLQRRDSVRVVVTSANLNSKQWNHVTNTVWWQDFPSRKYPDYSDFFCKAEDSKNDFLAHLTGFIAYLITDVPSQSHWIAELVKYDFGGATCRLVASIPGMHVQSPCYTPTNNFLSVRQSVYSNAASRFLGSVQASVVGLSHRFKGASDSSGVQLKTLASVLGSYQEKAGTLEVILKRNFNIPADANAVSVFVTNLDGFLDGEPDGVQLGFLPRDVAKWVSPLSDAGYFNFSAIIYPKETLEVVLSGSNTKVPLLLNVSQGPKFSEIASLMQPEYFAPLCSLLASIQRPLGIWRLQEVLSPYKWPESLETDFVYGSSSIGTSISPQFISDFSSAVGKRSSHLLDSEESDPEWGCWSISHELRNPSIRILFPTIERIKNGNVRIQASRCLLALSEKTWQRLKPAGIFHDAVPHPENRLGYPMHVKVARRRFQSKKNGVPSFGWIYSGSHNFSPAAWGQIASPSSNSNTSSSRLQICNYELGVVFIVPPPGEPNQDNKDRRSLDNIPLPFLMPAPRYGLDDRPATAMAMRHALAEARVMQREVSVSGTVNEEADEEIPEEDVEMVEVSDYQAEEKEEEKVYAEMLWSQVDSSES